ncbi:MAG: iron ABC transporter permease, partial [Planctomycetes bacterium]|nr:iron ABC transporter permease [Planctomycetota bacterium]
MKRYALALFILLFLGVFLAWPLGDVVVGAFKTEQGWTLDYITKLFTDGAQLSAILGSLKIAFFVTILTSAISVPLAWLFARRSFRGKGLFGALLLAPMILPPFVGAVGMKMIFSRTGPLSLLLMKVGISDGFVDWLGAYPTLGIVVLEALHLFPIMYLNLVAAFANVDPTLEEAAANLGASPWRVFRRVTFPLAAPGMFAGVIIVFIWSFTELGTPLVFGIHNLLPVRIFNSASQISTNPTGNAQVVLVLFITVVGFLVSKRITSRNRNVATLGRMSVSQKEQSLSIGGTLLAYLCLGAIILFAVLPHLSVVALSCSERWFMSVMPEGFTGKYFEQAIGMELTRSALKNSLALAISATIIDIILGFAIAWLCVRAKVKGASLIDAFSMLPLAVPGIVIAFGYMGCFTTLHHHVLAMLGGSGIDPKYTSFATDLLNPRMNPMLLLAASYSIRRLPYMVRAAHAGLEQVSRTYEEAAANLGAPAWHVVRKITLPLVAANLLAGAILCFSFSMLEVSDSLILAQTEMYYPITKAIYALMGGLENGESVAS